MRLDLILLKELVKLGKERNNLNRQRIRARANATSVRRRNKIITDENRYCKCRNLKSEDFDNESSFQKHVGFFNEMDHYSEKIHEIVWYKIRPLRQKWD